MRDIGLGTVAGVLVTVAAVVLFIKFPYLYAPIATNTPSFVQALASALGALLGFVIAALTIVIGFMQNDMLSVMNEAQLNGLFAAFRRAIAWLAGLFLLTLLCVISPHVFMLPLLLVIGCIVFLMVRRCLTMMEILTNKLITRTVQRAEIAERKRRDFDD